MTPGGQWWADTPRDKWPDDGDSVEQIESDWDYDTPYSEGNVGDRRFDNWIKCCSFFSFFRVKKILKFICIIDKSLFSSAAI